MNIADAVIEQALRAAIRAPSVHHTQPWRFVVASPFVELHLDRDRVLPVVDPAAREARISCGAALFNLRLAIEAAGRGAVVDLLPDPARPDFLAVLRVSGTRPVTPEQATLVHAVTHRATNRRPFTHRAVPSAHRNALIRAAEAERAHLVLLDTPKKLDTFATLLRRADHLQEEDPAFHLELRAWADRNDGDAEDGVPRSAGGPRPAGGLALQRVLLSVTVLGLSASFLSQPVEVPATRAAPRTLLEMPGQPQTALRLGYGIRAVGTSRRPVSAVSTIRTEVSS